MNFDFTPLLGIFDSTATEQWRLERWTGTVDADGLPSGGFTEVVGALDELVSYQEASVEDLKHMPEGDRHRESIWIYTSYNLRSIQAIGDRSKADRIIRLQDGGDGAGRAYVVARVDGDRSIGGVAGALCMLLDA